MDRSRELLLTLPAEARRHLARCSTGPGWRRSTWSTTGWIRDPSPPWGRGLRRWIPMDAWLPCDPREVVSAARDLAAARGLTLTLEADALSAVALYADVWRRQEDE